MRSLLGLLSKPEMVGSLSRPERVGSLSRDQRVGSLLRVLSMTSLSRDERVGVSTQRPEGVVTLQARGAWSLARDRQ